MPLSESLIKSSKPTDKRYRLSDKGNLYLVVLPTDNKVFRLDYAAPSGARKTLSIGQWPEITLLDARRIALEAKSSIKKGVDPSAVKIASGKAVKGGGGDSLEVVALDWLANKCNDKSPRPQRQLNFFLPWLGGKPMNDITAKDITDCLARVQARGTVYSAKKALQMLGQVYRYAVATSRADRDMTQGLGEALHRHEKQHFASITEPDDVAALVRAIDGYSGSFVTLCGLKLMALLFPRPGELRAMRWAEVDLVACEWRYLVTKTNIQQIVPLARQAVEILTDLKAVTGAGYWVFPSELNRKNTKEGRCMSENTLSAALKRLGYSSEEMTAHGFRAMARTLLDEVLEYPPHYIEQQLAHSVRDPLGRSYNRTSHLKQRREMMQSWANYLENLKNN